MLDGSRWPSENDGRELDHIGTFILLRLAFLEEGMWRKKADERVVRLVYCLPRKSLNRVYEVPVKKDSFYVPPVSHLLTFCGWKNEDCEDMDDGFWVDRDTTLYAVFIVCQGGLKLTGTH